jgi:tetratricopeptide (TPR) repeat protein
VPVPAGNRTVRYPEFRVLIRTSLLRCGVLSLAAVAILAGAPAASNPLEEWQALVTSGVNAITAKDLPKAEYQLQKAVEMTSQFPAGDPRTGTTLNILGLIYREEKKYGDAEKAFEKALAIFEKAYGADSLDTGNVNFNIASVLIAQAHYDDAMPYIQRSHTTYVRVLGAQSLKAAETLCMTGDVYRNQKKFQAAQVPLKECADVREAAEGIESADFGDALYSLGLVYAQLGRYELADSTLKMTEKIRELTLGVTSQAFADALEAHAGVLKAMKRDPEAAREEAMAAAIRRLGKKP